MTVAPIAVCIATFGPTEPWATLAHERAIASVKRQSMQPESIHWCHDRTLQRARNTAAAGADAEWLCFLDADDELDDHYLEAMAEVVGAKAGPALVQPATLGVYPDGREDAFPVLIPPRPLLDGNFMVIGTLVHRAQFHRLGGFEDLPIYEDWDLFIRAWLDGATILTNANAIYRVHVSANGRNNGCREQQIAVYNSIRQRHASALAVGDRRWAEPSPS